MRLTIEAANVLSCLIADGLDIRFPGHNFGYNEAKQGDGVALSWILCCFALESKTVTIGSKCVTCGQGSFWSGTRDNEKDNSKVQIYARLAGLSPLGLPAD